MSGLPHKLALYIGAGGTAALIALHFYNMGTELLSAIIILMIAAWLIYRVSGPELIWNTISMLKNPPVMGLMFFLGGFIYVTDRGGDFGEASLFGFAALILGVAAGMLVFKYWVIGD